jgi:hypothetical protein
MHRTFEKKLTAGDATKDALAGMSPKRYKLPSSD